MGLNLSEDLFLFSPNFRPKTGLNLSGEFFLLVFIILKFPAPHPLLKIMRTLVRQPVTYKVKFLTIAFITFQLDLPIELEESRTTTKSIIAYGGHVP